MQATGPKLAVHTDSLSFSRLSQPLVLQDLDVLMSVQEMKDIHISSKNEAENVKEEVKNKEEDEVGTARLYRDWTRGSVRRVTQQLEERMKQEHETPATCSSSSPPSVSGSTSCSQGHMPSVNPTSVEDDRTFELIKRESGDKTEEGAHGYNDASTKVHKLQPADIRMLSTSYPFHHVSLSPFASVNFLCLEGVTEMESATDWNYTTVGPPSDIVLRETWETLCELSAFLQQVSTEGVHKTRCVDQVFGLGASAPQTRCSSIQKKVREVEARIRQAGLTPPSQMKRSASLAKLGCLELLANDLSEWELSRTSVCLPSAIPTVHIGDDSKKQRVQACLSSADQQHDVPGDDVEHLSEPEETSTVVSLSSHCSSQRETSDNPDLESVHSPDLSLMTTRQQYGRTHPLRRLKKRTVSTVYHTM